MRALIIIAVIAWLVMTGLPGGTLLRRGRHPLLAVGGIVTSIAAGVLFLLIVAGVLDFFGDAFHESSIWLKATIVLFSVNLVLGHAGILVLMGGGQEKSVLTHCCPTNSFSPLGRRSG